MNRLTFVIAVLIVCPPHMSLPFINGQPPPPKADAAPESAEKPTPAMPEELKAEAARISYAMGMDIADFLKDLDTELDLDLFFRAIREVMAGKKTLITSEQALTIQRDFARKVKAERERKQRELAEKNRKAGEVFLAANKKKKGVVTTKSGLQYTVLKKADGALPKPTDQVKIDYVGTLLDGTEFDSSAKAGGPAVLSVTRVIPGFSEALQLMHVGGKYRVFIPSNLAYGPDADPPIGPNSTLIFVVELLSIEKEPLMPVLPGR